MAATLSDDQFVATLCGAVLDGTPATESTGRAKFQIAVTVCQRCRQGWQEGAGAKIAISPAAVERATCDAQHIGSIDGDTPERAYQDIAPSVARLVWRRDGGRCRTPGCRSARGLEIHHLVRRADGGGHDASNLALFCSSCHLAHHNGILTITGTADRLEVHRPVDPSLAAKVGAHVGAPTGLDTTALRTQGEVAIRRPTEPSSVVRPNAHVGAPTRLDAAVFRTQAKEALIGLGWKSAIATTAVAAASAVLGAGPTLERMIFEALRRCPRPAC